MTLSKQALQEALAAIERNQGSEEDGVIALAAARFVERLLPGKCDAECDNGFLFVDGVPDFHEACHGTGQLWDEGLVEIVGNAVAQEYRKAQGKTRVNDMARAVLAALAEEVGK